MLCLTNIHLDWWPCIGRTGKISEALRDILKIYDLQQVRDVNMKRTVALCALPVYLREEDPQFFKTWNVEESVEPGIIDTPVALVTEDTADPVNFEHFYCCGRRCCDE